MKVLHETYGKTKKGEDYSVVVMKPTGTVRPAKRTTREDFISPTSRSSLLRSLFRKFY